MTDNDLRSEIAAIRSTLRHIEAELTDAKEHRKETSALVQDFITRLVRLETGGAVLSGLPKQVHQNEVSNIAQEARHQAHQEATEAMRKTVLAGFAIAGTVSSIIGLLASWLMLA
jgi:predicted  nucleic acid-binding Zn-ribbon protein